MDAPRYFAPLVLISLAAFAGCQEQQAGTITAIDRKLAWSAPTWSEPVEGIQCRLRISKRRWYRNETPVLSVDFKNTGWRIYPFLPDHMQQLCEVQYDGNWYYWPTPVKIDSPVWPLAPGVQLNSVSIRLHNRFGIDLERGKHIIRVAFNFEGVRVESNPLGIIIVD